MIDKQTPQELDLNIIIVDNYATNKHGMVKQSHNRHQRFHAHFVPTIISWLSIVERFFRNPGQKRLNRDAFRSVPS